MAQRRLLVIGSQCHRLNRLDFLPEVAERLHVLLIHPGPGECVGVPLDGRTPGLLLDPTVAEAKAAIKLAFEDAARESATFILAYIGHGEFPDERSGDFYLMPTNATEPTSDDAIHFAEFIKDRLKGRQDHAGLFVLLDACHAGAGAWQSMERWAQSLRGNIGFELLTATDDRATANAPLARAVIELLEQGDPEAGDQLHGRDVHRLLRERNRPPQHVAYNADDARLALARNRARDPGEVFWKDSPGRTQILKQTEYFQPTPQLDELVEAARAHPVVVLTGAAGAGKSSLAVALARPEVAGGHVPDGFVHAVAVLGLTTNQRSLADDLERQLRRSLPEFADAVAEFERSVPRPEREMLDFLPRKVLRPLACLARGPEVRIVLDGFDQLRDGTREAVDEALGERPGHLRLVITARPDTPGCPPGHALHHGPTPRDDLDRYLASRRVPEPARRAILDRTGEHWLVARLLADAVLTDPATDLAQLPGTVDDAYAKLLDQAGAADAWNRRFRPVLGPLAIAGSGPVLPLALLAYASETLGGPEGVEDARDVLAHLRGLVVRRDADAPEEHAGLFHPTLAEYLLGPSASRAGYTLDAEAAHRAMVQAIEALAPMGEHDRDDPLHRYAFLREADHLWAIGDIDRTLACLRNRTANIPRENLERLRPWLSRFRSRFSEDHPTILNLRGWVAYCTAEAGDARGALRLSSALLPDRERVLGREHPDTLTTRLNIAYWTGEVGYAHEALRLYRELLPDQERVLGCDHPNTLATRHNIAAWTGEVGDAREVLRLYRELLPDRERLLGPDHPDTLRIRGNIAHWTGEAGDAGGALRLFTDLLPDLERVLGRDHPDTLTTLGHVGVWAIRCGATEVGCQWLREGLTRAEARYGPDDPLTRRFQDAIRNFGCGVEGPETPVTPELG